MLHDGSRLRSRLDTHLQAACRWLERAGASSSGEAHAGWSWIRSWHPPTTRATAAVAVTLAHVARSESCAVDTSVALRCGAALLARQRHDGLFAPIGADEEEEPATSASIEAACALYELTGDESWRTVAVRGALRLLAARARPSSALALSAAWSCAPDERLWSAARDGMTAAQQRLHARVRAPLSSLRETVEDLDVLLTGARRIREEVELEPADRAAISALVARVEASSGTPSAGYDATGALTRPGVDLDVNARAAAILFAIDEGRADPRVRYAGNLVVASLIDGVHPGAWIEGMRGAVGRRVGVAAPRSTIATARLASALAGARRCQARITSRVETSKPMRRAWWTPEAAHTAQPPAHEARS